MKTSVLVVDDEFNQRQALAMQLERKGFSVSKSASGKEALTAMDIRKFEFALVDLRMKEMDGLELLRRIKMRWPETVVIMMTAYQDISTAIEAIKAGAFHYLAKPIKLDELLETIDKATPERQKDPFHGIDGESAAMKSALALARHAAGNDKPVLLTGELGTGKESLAQAIHASSARAKYPCVPVRCSGDEEQLDYELFGRGSTTPGRLFETSGGSILLDKVHTITPRIQDRLMRFLQDGEIVRDGRPVRVDVRVMAAAPTDLRELVEAGQFRQDLQLLLGSIHIHLPPLRERPADIPNLVRMLVDRYTPKGSGKVKVHKEAMAVLQGQAWPGNLVELEGLMEHAVSLAGSEGITPEVLRKAGVEETERVETGRHTLKEDLEREEKKLIEESLARNNHNLKLVAIDLGISRTSLWRKMKRFGLAEE